MLKLLNIFVPVVETRSCVCHDISVFGFDCYTVKGPYMSRSDTFIVNRASFFPSSCPFPPNNAPPHTHTHAASCHLGRLTVCNRVPPPYGLTGEAFVHFWSVCVRADICVRASLSWLPLMCSRWFKTRSTRRLTERVIMMNVTQMFGRREVKQCGGVFPSSLWSNSLLKLVLVFYVIITCSALFSISLNNNSWNNYWLILLFFSFLFFCTCLSKI